MIVSISQPAYLPWLGYIERIALSDVHIVLDHVQFEKRSFTSRNKIRTPNGWVWLSAPVKTKGKHTECPINALELNNATDWRKDHILSLESNYKKTQYYGDHATYLQNLYTTDWLLLNDVLTDMRNYLVEFLGIKTKILFSSELNSPYNKDELILDLCKMVGTKIYISGPFGRDYLNEDSFKEAGMEIYYHDYSHPEYPQRWKGFEPYMTIFDLLFNCGEKSMEILKTTDPSLLKVRT